MNKNSNQPSRLKPPTHQPSAYVIGGKGDKVLPACQPLPELQNLITEAGIQVQGVQSLPYIAIDRIKFTYTFIIRITNPDFLLTMDKKKLTRKLAFYLKGIPCKQEDNISYYGSLLNGGLDAEADESPVFDTTKHTDTIIARTTAYSLNFRRVKLSVKHVQQFPSPFQWVTTDDFNGELPVQLHLPEQNDYKAHHEIAIIKEEKSGNVFLHYTIFFSGNPQRALRHHPFLSKANLSHEDYVRAFYRSTDKSINKEADNYLDDDQTPQKDILNSLTNVLQSFLALHYADLRRAIDAADTFSIDGLKEAVDMPRNWQECQCKTHLTKMEVDWHFRVPSAPFFVTQLGLALRPRIRDYAFRNFEEGEYESKSSSSKLLSWDWLPNGFIGYPCKGIEISVYAKTKTLVRLEVRLSYSEGMKSKTDDVKVPGVHSSVITDSYQGLLNRILKGVLSAHKRLEETLGDTNKGFIYVDNYVEDPYFKIWHKKIIQLALAQNNLEECQEILDWVRSRLQIESYQLSSQAKAFIQKVSITKSNKPTESVFFLKVGKNGKNQRFYPILQSE